MPSSWHNLGDIALGVFLVTHAPMTAWVHALHGCMWCMHTCLHWWPWFEVLGGLSYPISAANLFMAFHLGMGWDVQDIH